MANRTCSIADCGRALVKPHGRGMCSMHYQRWRKHGDPHHEPDRPKRQGVEPCAIEGCEKVIKGRGWCAAHYSRWQRHGTPTGRVRAEVVDGKRICPVCGEDKPLGEWTSGRCRACARQLRAEWRKRNPQSPKVDEIRACDYCGSWFAANKKRSRYCSTPCFEQNRNRANWPYMVARQERMRGAIVERFDRAEIFERDGWACGICGEPIDRNAVHPDPRSASVDHIVPLSRGGEHSRANAQASHLVCNLRKATSMP